MKELNVGVIGCGMISEIYMKNCTQLFDNIRLVACADINIEAAQRRAEQFGCRAESVDELLSDTEVDIVLNLTIPSSHAEISMKALKAGKHVYSEKPMTIDIEAGIELLKYANENNLFVGNAPDCFMGGGHQTCRKLIDEGVIGTPFAAQAFFFSRGPEYFHPNPEFFYKKGAGPVLDWGPYYISELVSLFGPVKRIASLGKKPFEKRKVRSEKSPLFGKEFSIDVLSYVTSILEFESGFTATLTVSFDMFFPYWESKMPFIRVFGTKGNMDVPDTNKYEGPVIVRDAQGIEQEYPIEFGFTENSRGIGLHDMAHAIINGGTYRANGDFGLHVSEVLIKMQEAAETGEFCSIQHTCVKPDPWQANVKDNIQIN